jgi:catechol 2,3-dioxygenase-like lactoylglutathione lyase family enzyme
MQRVIPALRMTDYARSRAFYVDGLGFAIEWEHRFKPGFPVFAKATRDGMSIYLTEHTGDCEVGGLVYFYVPDVDAVHAEFHGRGVAIEEPPNEGIPGLRMMLLADPDGNRVCFVTRLEDRRTVEGEGA